MEKKFEELGLSQELVTVIREAGFETPSEIQERAIPLAIAGKDIIGAAATGSGKTLAFASPMIENLKPNKTVQALVLTPTRELAEQVANSIIFFSKNRRLNITSIYGGVNIENQIKKISGTDIIVGTPGIILDHLERKTLRLNNIKFLVLDEVDRMFDMGFLKDVEKILANCSKERQTMLFSATISTDINYLSKRHTKNPVEISVKSYVDSSKLKQIYYDVENDEKFSLLVHLLKKEIGGLAMVFCGTKHKTDFVARNLIRQGINAKAIHGGLVQNKRTAILKEFHGKNVGVLVCTDVAARGLDIKGVSYVYNYDLPQTNTGYIHRIGRTARAGNEGKVINLISNADYENFNNILNDKQIFITPEQKPEFQKVYVELNRNFGNRQFRRFGENQYDNKPRKFGNQNNNRSRPQRGRTNRFSNRSYQGRSNFHNKDRKGNR